MWPKSWHKTGMQRILTSLILAAAISASPVQAAPDPDESAFRQTYQTLVETDTTLAHGDCTLAASRMAQVLRDAGYADAQLVAYAAPDHPKEGGLVAIWPGRRPI